MAIPISLGSGATLASEVLNGEHYSFTKLVDGRSGSNIPASIVSNASGNQLLVTTLDTLNVNVGNTVPVTGAFYQATQPVSFNQLVSLASGTQVGLNPSSNWVGLVSLASINGNVNVTNTVPVTGTFWQSTQPVSFTQLVSLASGTQVGINPSSNWIGLVSLASINGNVNVTNTVSVTGSFYQATQPVSFTQLVSLASGTLVGLNPSANYIGLVSAASINGTVTNAAGSNWIGLVSLASINGNINVTNSGAVSNASLATTLLDSIAIGQYGGDAKGSLASGSYHPIQLDNFGNIKLGTGSNYIGLVSLASINGNVNITNGSLAVTGTFYQSTQPVSFTQLVSLASGTLVGLNPSTNWIGLVSLASINGTVSFNQLVSLASGTLVGLNPSANFIGLVSLASINGTVTNAAGTNFIGLVSTASINGTVTNAAGSNWIGLVSLASINGIVSLTPGTTGGWTPYMFASLSSLAQQVKASAGELGGYYIYNPNAAVTYIQVFDIANSSVSLGVRAPTLTFGIPATSGANLEFANGVNFATAIQVAATTTPNGSTGPTTPVPVNIIYK